MTDVQAKREPGVPSDLFVWRASDFTEDRDMPNTLAFSATHEGILVYSADSSSLVMSQHPHLTNGSRRRKPKSFIGVVERRVARRIA